VLLLLAALLAPLAFFAVGALRVDYPLVSGVERSMPRGAFHVHTTASDGRGTPEEIALAAKEAGLQFVVFADHNVEDLPPPRYEHGVLLVFGVELSTPHGHVVALGLPRGLTREERAQDALGHIARLGGHSFLAHPEQKKNPWRAWGSAAEATGLELYSADTMFRIAQAHPLSIFVPALGSYFGNPRHGLMTLVRAQPELTFKLASLAAARPTAAVCSHDAHGLPPYLDVFQTLSMYLPLVGEGTSLPEDPAFAARAVVTALAEGRAFCAFHALGDGDGFALEGVDAQAGARVGDVLRVVLPTTTPPQVEVRIAGPGTLLEDGQSVRLEAPGAVQVEVWAKVPGLYFEDGWKPWLVPSPVRISARDDERGGQGEPDADLLAQPADP
jgi:hypothetical protein